MKRLIQGMGNNSPEVYDAIFKERHTQGVHWADMRRWKYLLKHYRGGKIIDLGCLDSLICEMVEPKNYLGIDLAKNAIKIMQDRYPYADFMVDDICKLRLSAHQYEYAVLGEVIEHLEKPEDAVKETFRILKPGGVLALSTPLEEEKELGACDAERHLWSFDKHDIIKLLSPYSSKVRIKILGSRWFPYRYVWPTIIAFAWKK